MVAVISGPVQMGLDLIYALLTLFVFCWSPIDDAYSGITPFRAAIVCSDFCVCAMVGAKGNLAKTVPSPRSYTQNTRQLGIPLFQRIVSIKVSKQ